MSARPPTQLPDDLGTCHQMIAHLLSDMQDKDREILNLKCQLEMLKRRIFGRSSEKVDPDQLALFEDLTRRWKKPRLRAVNRRPPKIPGRSRIATVTPVGRYRQTCPPKRSSTSPPSRTAPVPPVTRRWPASVRK